MLWLFVRPPGFTCLDFFESLSLLYLLFISLFICSGRWCTDKLGVFHANQISMYWSTSEFRVSLAPWNKFKPSSKIFYWHSKVVLLLWIFYVFFCLVFVMPLCVSVYFYLVVTSWERAGLLALVCGVTVSLPLPHWYPGSGVVLNCIDSWSWHLTI